MFFFFKGKKKMTSTSGQKFLRVYTTTCLDGERTISVRYLKIHKYELFGQKSKLKGQIKKVYFTENGNEKCLTRFCIKNSDHVSKFKTPGLKTPRDYDPYSSCTNCTIVEQSEIDLKDLCYIIH